MNCNATQMKICDVKGVIPDALLGGAWGSLPGQALRGP